MTRWARAGNTQKHKKMPEDPTPWEEFALQRKAVDKPQKKFLIEKMKKVSSDATSTSLKRKLKQRLKKKTGEQQHLIENAEYDEKESDSNELDSALLPTQDEVYSENENFQTFKHHVESDVTSEKSKKWKISKFPTEVKNAILKNKKLKIGKKRQHKIAIEPSISSDSEDFCADQTNSIGSLKNKKHKTVKRFPEIDKDESLSSDTEPGKYKKSEIASDLDPGPSIKVSDTADLISNGTKSNPNQKKRKSFYENVKAKRSENGILLLPRSVEDRLYRMKRSLRARGISGEEIKATIRAVRRKAELKYKKTLKTCFNCRESGHVLANCPKIAEDNEQGTGICFKCGSTEHISFKCHIKAPEYPFAKCFVCHNTGHLSRSCPENDHGIYPKGGKCNLCGSIFHLRKDCPKSSGNKDGESREVTVHTINESRSVDDEIVEMESKTIKPKGPKLVKF